MRRWLRIGLLVFGATFTLASGIAKPFAAGCILLAALMHFD